MLQKLDDKSTSCYTRFQCYVHRRHLSSSFDMPSFVMLLKRLKDCLTVKQVIFRIISGGKDKLMIVTELTWLKKIVNIASFQIYGIIKTICV